MEVETILKNDTENSISNNTQKTAFPATSHIKTNMCGRINTHLLQKFISVLLIEKLACEQKHKR